jgi:hypothetical protein
MTRLDTGYWLGVSGDRRRIQVDTIGYMFTGERPLKFIYILLLCTYLYPPPVCCP